MLPVDRREAGVDLAGEKLVGILYAALQSTAGVTDEIHGDRRFHFSCCEIPGWTDDSF